MTKLLSVVISGSKLELVVGFYKL